MMRVLLALVATVGLSVAAPSLAAPDDESGVSDEDRVTGKKPPPLKGEPSQTDMDVTLDKGMTYAEYRDRPYPHKAYLAAEAMQMDPKFVHGIQEGLELLYLRRYSDSKDHFHALEATFPGTGIGSVVDTLVWQALMLENFDYKYDKQYWTASKQAKKELERALETPGSEAWEHLLMATIVGMESIHTMRQSQYLSALQLAFSAMDHIERSRQAAPKFVDLDLADGLYNYWRSVVTMNSKVLPDFGDERVKGIEQMQRVEDRGLFIAPLATLSMAFTWVEEDQLKKALAACAKNRRAYPDNIVNNLVTGMVYTYMRRYDNALGVFDEILEDDAKNRRVHYWRGLALQRKGDVEPARAEFTTYLGSDYLEDYQVAYTNYRLGQLSAKDKDWPGAETFYKAAVKADGHKGAKKALDRMKERKKEGKIDY